MKDFSNILTSQFRSAVHDTIEDLTKDGQPASVEKIASKLGLLTQAPEDLSTEQAIRERSYANATNKLVCDAIRLLCAHENPVRLPFSFKAGPTGGFLPDGEAAAEREASSNLDEKFESMLAAAFKGRNSMFSKALSDLSSKLPQKVRGDFTRYVRAHDHLDVSENGRLILVKIKPSPRPKGEANPHEEYFA